VPVAIESIRLYRIIVIPESGSHENFFAALHNRRLQANCSALVQSSELAVNYQIKKTVIVDGRGRWCWWRSNNRISSAGSGMARCNALPSQRPCRLALSRGGFRLHLAASFNDG
jgi:hypothetical protein